jgi:hypothetical protein
MSKETIGVNNWGQVLNYKVLSAGPYISRLDPSILNRYEDPGYDRQDEIRLDLNRKYGGRNIPCP